MSTGDGFVWGLGDLLGVAHVTARMRGGDTISPEVFDALRERVLQSETFGKLSPERQAQALESLDEQIGVFRGTPIREASAKSVAQLITRSVTQLEPLKDGIMGLAQSLDNPAHIFGLGCYAGDLATALMLLEGVAAGVVHTASCACLDGKEGKHEEKKPEQ